MATGDDRRPAAGEPLPCAPCRGTGQLISSIGGEQGRVPCPWCEGGGAQVPGHDAQAAPRARAAAATAALDSARRRDALMRQTTAASPAPAPRTPEQRAQTYLRIGLDEAAKQLGRPVHVIEGMSPLFMGLARGGTSPGADAARPVVRVVYQDSQGRLIFLDQQRLRPGQGTASPGADPHWTAGEISLHLSGEVGVEVLRRLRTRVR